MVVGPYFGRFWRLLGLRGRAAHATAEGMPGVVVGPYFGRFWCLLGLRGRAAHATPEGVPGVVVGPEYGRFWCLLGLRGRAAQCHLVFFGVVLRPCFEMESTDAILARYLEVFPTDWVSSMRLELGLSGGGGLFTHALTCWLMIRQRLEGCSVEDAWLTMSPELAARFSPTSKRASTGKLSSWHGGYDHARRSLPLKMVEAVADRLFIELSLAFSPPAGPSAFILDGTSLSPDGSAALREAYPPGRNQHKTSHFPMLKMVVAHDLWTGLALRPSWGPMYGEDATSEQALALTVASRLPENAIVMGDRNFGVFWLAHAFLRDGHPCLFRLTDSRAKALAGKSADLSFDQDRELVWRASRADLSKHPELVPGEQIQGRLVVRHVQPPGTSRMVRLVFFASGLEQDADELAKLYAKRWNVETDLRTLKKTLNLARLSSRLPEVLANELVLGVCAYNLVRAFGALAAQRIGVNPRVISFSRMAACLKGYSSRFAAAQGDDEIQRLFEEMLERAAARKLKPRNREHPPRETYRRHQKFPPRKN